MVVRLLKIGIVVKSVLFEILKSRTVVRLLNPDSVIKDALAVINMPPPIVVNVLNPRINIKDELAVIYKLSPTVVNLLKRGIDVNNGLS